jgi:hypothetical protein
MKENDYIFFSGLCGLASGLMHHSLISWEERDRIWGYIAAKKRKNKYWPYYWKQSEWQPRLDWINKQILKEEKK